MPPLTPLNNPQPPQGYNPNPAPQPQSPQAPGSSPYDFFLEQQHKTKRPLLPKHTSGLTKLILVAVGLFVVLIIIAVVLHISRGSTKDTAPGLGNVAQSQQEIIHIATAAETDAADSESLENFANTAVSVTTTAQQQILAYSAKNGGQISAAQIANYSNASIDSQLTAALSASTYDTTFQTIMQQLLTSYADQLQQIHDSATLASEQALLEQNMTSVQLLQKMLAE